MPRVDYMLNNVSAFCHLDDNFTDIFNVVRDNHSSYFTKHNIPYKVFRTHELIDHQPVNKELYWLKIIALQRMLVESQNEWIFMFDVDCVFLRNYIPLSFFTSCCNKDQDILMCYMDKSIKNFWNVNIGCMFFRKSKFNIDLIQKMLDSAKASNFQLFEQFLLQQMLKQDVNNIIDKVGFFPEHTFNHGNKNSFLFHACGSSTSNLDFDKAKEQKIEVLNRILNESI